MPDGYKLAEEFEENTIDFVPAVKKQKTNV